MKTYKVYLEEKHACCIEVEAETEEEAIELAIDQGHPEYQCLVEAKVVGEQ